MILVFVMWKGMVHGKKFNSFWNWKILLTNAAPKVLGELLVYKT